MDTKRKPVLRAASSSLQSNTTTTASSSNARIPTTVPSPNEDVSRGAEHDLPPSYTGPSLPASPGSPGPSRGLGLPIPQHGMPPVDFKSYRIAGVTLSKDKMTYTTNMSHYSQSPQALSDLIQRHARLPPHPQIHIFGRTQDGSAPTFSIKISMMKYIVRSPDARGSAGWQYVRTISDGELGWRGGKQIDVHPSVNGGLDEWISRYVMEEIKDKSFALTKQVTNWNTDYLEGQIRTLVASTGYKGRLQVTFPVTHSTLVVQGPKESKAWYEAIADVFKSKNSRRYEIVTAIWPYAALTPDDASGQGNAYAVKSEMQFWTEWKDVLKAAVLDRHKGWLSIEDHMEWMMGNGWEGKKQTGAWVEEQLQC